MGVVEVALAAMAAAVIQSTWGRPVPVVINGVWLYHMMVPVIQVGIRFSHSFFRIFTHHHIR